MQPDVTDLSQMSQVISHATAPAFLLGAVAGFVSILITRMSGIIDRSRSLNMIADEDTPQAHLKSDIPRLKHRARLMNDAIYLSIGSGICTTVLVVLAFASALWRSGTSSLSAFCLWSPLACWARPCSRSRVRCGSRSTSSTTTHEAPRHRWSRGPERQNSPGRSRTR